MVADASEDEHTPSTRLSSVLVLDATEDRLYPLVVGLVRQRRLDFVARYRSEVGVILKDIVKQVRRWGQRKWG